MGFLLTSGSFAQLPIHPEQTVSGQHLADTRARLIAGQAESALIVWGRNQTHNSISARWLKPFSDSGGERVLVPTNSVFTDADANASGAMFLAYDWAGGTFLQRTSEDGEPIGSPVLVSVGAELAVQADLFVRSDGSVVVACVTRDTLDENSTQQISFRIFNSAGAPVTGLVRVSTRGDRFHYEPRVDGDQEGNFTVAWSEDVPGQEGTTEIYRRRYSGAGVPQGPSDPLANAQAGSRYLGDIECSPSGSCVAVWQGYAESSFEIFYRLFLPSGESGSEALRANQSVEFTQYRPSVSVNRDGDFAIGWTSEFQASRIDDIYVRLFRRDARPASDEFRVNELSADNLDDASEVLLTDQGSLRVAWVNFHGVAPGKYTLMERRFLRNCAAESPKLELDNGRFAICSRWEKSSGEFGHGTPVPLRETSGGFWFFEPSVLELLVKSIDACSENDAFWTFAAGLTNLEVDFTIWDREAGLTATYWNRQGQAFRPVLDIDSLRSCGDRRATALAERSKAAEFERANSLGSGTCTPDATHLCLMNGRFRVSVQWRDFAGNSNAGQANGLTEDSGLFWFFDAENLEIAAKVLDGCGVNGHYWVYLAGLTNVQVDVDVEDTLAHRSWSRSSELGSPFPPIQDIQAFATCN